MRDGQISDAGQDVGEPSLRIGVVEAGRGDQREHDGGAIGAYALVRLKDSAALPGVAIATALMPPLCTVGIGLAARDRGIWGGAFLLFATNLLAITFSCAIVFWSLGLRPRRSSLPALRLALGAVSGGVIGVALFGLSVRAVQESREARELRSTVASALADVIPGSELVDIERSSAPEGGLEVRVTARTPGQSTLVEATANSGTRCPGNADAHFTGARERARNRPRSAEPAPKRRDGRSSHTRPGHTRCTHSCADHKADRNAVASSDGDTLAYGRRPAGRKLTVTRQPRYH